MTVPNLLPALPELFLALASLLLLVFGVTRPVGGGTRLVSWIAVGVLLIDLLLVVSQGADQQITFSGLFVTDGFARFMKALILTGSGFSIILALQFNERNKIDRFEYPVLILLATTGMLVMVSANDLISLYVGLELQSLALYVLAAFKRDTIRSTEAGLKYFVLGGLSSGMLLFGASLIYGFGGSTNFTELAHLLANPALDKTIGLTIGIVFLSVGLAFKCSAVPFHMWTPDVYEGAPTPVTAFFAVAPKIAALSLFLRVMLAPLASLFAAWGQIIWAIALLSMILGAYAAISQTNIKRLMAYSSIGNVGYALIGLAVGTADGVQGLLVYLAIYMVMTLGSFAVILCMERAGKSVETIEDLSGLSQSQPILAAGLAIFMFSMAGIPPLAGFFSKLVVFQAAIHSGYYALAILGVLASVVGCFYYLRIVKVMYFDAVKLPFDAEAGGFEVRAIVVLSAAIMLVFCLIPNTLLQAAGVAAHSLFPG